MTAIQLRKILSNALGFPKYMWGLEEIESIKELTKYIDDLECEVAWKRIVDHPYKIFYVNLEENTSKTA